MVVLSQVQACSSESSVHSAFALRFRNLWHFFMKADVLPEQTGITVSAEVWGTDILVLTDEQKAALKAQADKLII